MIRSHEAGGGWRRWGRVMAQAWATVRKRNWTTAAGEEKTAWIVDYKDAAGKRHIDTYARKRDADEKAHEIRGELRAGVHVPSRTSVTVGKAADLWLDACENGDAAHAVVEASTLRNYRQHVETFIRPQLGATKLADLSVLDVRGFANMMVADHGRSRARKVLTSLKSLLNHAEREGYVARNVAKLVKVERDKRNGDRTDVAVEAIPGREALKAIAAKLNDLAEQPHRRRSKEWRRYRAFIMTAALTGMRASELRGLAWNQVDRKQGLIKVRQRADENGTIGPPKSEAGLRDIIVPPALVTLLKAWKLECPNGENRLVFPNWRGNVESLANIHTRCWKPLLRACKLPPWRFHDLRHYRASVLIADGANAKEVQREMGHATITITLDLYAKLLKEDDTGRRDRAKRLAAEICV